MQREVEDRLSEKILHGELESGDHVKVGVENGQFSFETSPRGEKVAIGVGTAGEIAATPTPSPAADTATKEGPGCHGIRAPSLFGPAASEQLARVGRGEVDELIAPAGQDRPNRVEG